MVDGALEVVIGLISQGTQQCQYLLAQRRNQQSFAGLWEFPGGKIEQGESPTKALQRELMEELGINIDTQNCHKVMFIPWRYDGIKINLHIYRVNHYALSPYSAEGQMIKWWNREDITVDMLPPANCGLIGAINLPCYYAISGEFADAQDFIDKVERTCQKGITLLQIRISTSNWSQWCSDDDFVTSLRTIKKKYSCRFMLNSRCIDDVKKDKVLSWQLPSSLEDVIVGWHICSRDLSNEALPSAIEYFHNYQWGASVHDEKELADSHRLKIDFICVSPILPTTSDSNKIPIGMTTAKQLIDSSTVPVYLLGGLSEQHLQTSKQHGAHGIAAVSAFWD